MQSRMEMEDQERTRLADKGTARSQAQSAGREGGRQSLAYEPFKLGLSLPHSIAFQTCTLPLQPVTYPAAPNSPALEGKIYLNS